MNAMNTREDIEIDLFLEGVYRLYHYDFRNYSRTFIKRRLNLIKTLSHCESFSMLQHKVLHDPLLIHKLLNYITIQVGDMFRDPDYFLSLRRIISSYLSTYSSIKVWIAGCGTGEELYSLAILFREEGLENRTQFFATDINFEALKRAEAGVYGMDRLESFENNYKLTDPKHSFSKYYTVKNNYAVLDSTLKENTVFYNHSLVSDSVFGEMHLISCRNVLIYFDNSLQERAIGLFNDALVRKGFLGLGAKESLYLSPHADNFAEFQKKDRIYQKMAVQKLSPPRVRGLRNCERMKGN